MQNDIKRGKSPIGLSAVMIVAMSAFAGNVWGAQSKPNVVLIISDDMGYGDLSSYGASDIKTPSIDSLARDGVKFTDFYANAPVCSPTRAGLLTGRYQQRYGIESPLPQVSTAAEQGLPATSRSLPKLLKSNGYATALVGKWHLGYKPENTPNAHGFDYFFGFRAGYQDFYRHTDGNGIPDLWENNEPVTETGYMTDLITTRSTRFIEQNAKRPFYLQVAYNAPHWPYQTPDAPSTAIGNARHLQPDEVPTSTRKDYALMVERMDQGVGEILRTLERLSLTNNTIVIFTNDNGGEWLSRGAPLFNRKGTVWEGGIRVPTLIRWPGNIPEGQVSPQVGITMDLTASILAITGAPMPPDTKLEGINLFPIIQSSSPAVERTLFWRSGQGSNQRAVRSGDWKLVVEGTVMMLFDVRKDMGERNDVTNQNLDVVARLRPLITEWEKDVDDEAKANGLAAVNRRTLGGGGVNPVQRPENRGSAPSGSPVRPVSE